MGIYDRMNRSTFFNMNFSKIFFMFLSVIVRQCESTNYFENSFIFVGYMDFEIFLQNRSIGLRDLQADQDENKHIDICKSLYKLPLYRFTNKFDRRNNFLDDIENEFSPPFDSSRTESIPKDDDLLPLEKTKSFTFLDEWITTLSCKWWSESELYIIEIIDTEYYLLFNEMHFVIHDQLIYFQQPFGLILKFFPMSKKDDPNGEYKKIFEKYDLQARLTNSRLVLPIFRDWRSKEGHTNFPNYNIFMNQLCVSSLLYTVGNQIKTQIHKISQFQTSIKEWKLDIGILGIKIEECSSIKMTVIDCEYNNQNYILVPHRINNKLLYIVKDNNFSLVELNFNLDHRCVPNN